LSVQINRNADGEGNMNIAIIPARGGSKRIHRKNIKSFCGNPIITWSINAAKESGLFDRVIVSTDDAEIAKVAKNWGADVPFIRPQELSNDFAGTTKVIAHATQWALNEGLDLQAVCCIYATAPLIQSVDLKKGLLKLYSGNWDYAFSVSELNESVFRAFKLTEAGGIDKLFPEYESTRTQDLPTAYQDAGQFYWGRPDAWANERLIFSQNSIPVLLPKWRVQDIDNWDDWLKAEKIFKELQRENNVN
jgi:pseudaminic acid cytidylyltransferase